LQRWDILWFARYKARGFRRIDDMIREGICAVAFEENNIGNGSGDSKGVLKAGRARSKSALITLYGVPVAAFQLTVFLDCFSWVVHLARGYVSGRGISVH
jgi:hypothetical protein